MKAGDTTAAIWRTVDIDPAEVDWNVEADVVVAGSGAAGHAAAIAARSRGASVVILERASHIGGTTAKSGGAVFWVPNNSYMRAAGMTDDKADALNYMARVAYPREFQPNHPTLGLEPGRYSLIEAFYDGASRAIDELVSAGALDPEIFADVPDYSAEMPENKAPYGRMLRPRGVSLADGGTTLVATLSAAAERMGIRTITDSRVTGLVRDPEGAVVGAQVQGRRDTMLVHAHQAVVFATGGFAHNPKMVSDYLRGPILGGCAADTSTGDFVSIGIDVGADLGNMSNAWWSQGVLDQMAHSRSTSRDITFNFGDSMFFVNKYGRRVVNEKSPYNDRGQVHHHWNAADSEFSNLFLFMIYDDDVAQSEARPYHRNPVPLKGESAAYVLSGETFGELAESIDRRLAELDHLTNGVRLAEDFAENLDATVERFNSFATTGVDRDFKRGATAIEHTFHAPVRGDGYPNPTLHPLRSSGPYHAIILAPAALDTKGGPRTDGAGRVLDVLGEPIRGLYGAGNCVASAAGEGYWGAGGTIGPALAFGCLAGVAATEESRR